MTYRTHISMALGISTLPLSIPFLLDKVEYFDIFKNVVLKNGYLLLDFYKINTSNDNFNLLFLLSFFYIFIIIGSLFPDIDHSKAKIGKLINKIIYSKISIIMYILLFLITFRFQIFENTNISNYLDLSILNNYINIYKNEIKIFNHIFLLFLFFIVIKQFGSKLNHRGPTHDLIYIFGTFIFLSIIINLIKYNYILFLVLPIFIGSLIHVFSDTLTVSGVKLFGVISNKSYKLLPKKLLVKTASEEEFIYWYKPFLIMSLFNIFYFSYVYLTKIL